MGFLDSIEKLITEHGSAAILKERIQLLNDRHADLERKCKTAEDERDSLRVENSSLRAEVEAIQAEIDKIRRLQEKANRQRNEELSGADRLPAEREMVLQVICYHPGLEPRQVASVAGIGEQMTQWHIDTLEKQRLIHGSYSVATPWTKGGCTLQITDTGRDYLARNGLLSG